MGPDEPDGVLEQRDRRVERERASAGSEALHCCRPHRRALVARGGRERGGNLGHLHIAAQERRRPVAEAGVGLGEQRHQDRGERLAVLVQLRGDPRTAEPVGAQCADEQFRGPGAAELAQGRHRRGNHVLVGTLERQLE